jgi:hypothetical protein
VLLIVVAVGTPESAQNFSDSLPFPAENIYVDPSRAAYRALEFHGRGLHSSTSQLNLSRV